MLFITAAVLSFAVCPSRASGQRASPARTLVIGVLSYESGESTAPDTLSRNAERGLAMGIEEARETGLLFGRDVQERRAVIKRGDDALKSARTLLRTTNMSALLVTNRELVGVAQRIALEYPLLFIRTLPSPEKAACSDFIFTLYGGANPLDSMRMSESGLVSGGHAVSQTVSLWHPSLEKFGARELNDRYHSRWHAGMGSEAWAAWMAVKILSEASVRKQTTKPALLSAYIKNAEFDGHKGWPLSFRPADHMLRQPYYIVMRAGTSISVQAMPAGDRSPNKSAAQVLDELDPPEPGARCASVSR
jgi:hypothetical protein